VEKARDWILKKLPLPKYRIHTTKNLSHVFQPKHNLDKVFGDVSTLSKQQSALKEIANEVRKQYPNLKGEFQVSPGRPNNLIVNVRGKNINVGGKVIDNIFYLSDALLP
jgi:hypothetical protein